MSSREAGGRTRSQSAGQDAPRSTPSAVVERDGPIARVLLTRDERRNSWTPAFGADLTAAFEEVAADDSIRAVILSGGSSFCSGADLSAGIIDSGDLERVLEENFNPAVRALRAVPQPVVSAVQGMAIGAGWVLAVSCDLVVAGESAKFSLPFTRLGVCPDVASTALFPALIGRLRAAELMLLADRIDAQTAQEWGLINRLVPDDAVEATARELAERLATGAPLALRAAKRLLDAPGDQAFAEQVLRESVAQGELGRSKDIGRAVEAFKERRQPVFEGN